MFIWMVNFKVISVVGKTNFTLMYKNIILLLVCFILKIWLKGALMILKNRPDTRALNGNSLLKNVRGVNDGT